MPAIAIEDLAQYNSIDRKSTKCVLFFWASWHELSQKGGQLQQIFDALSEKYSRNDIAFYLIEAESVPEVSEKLGIAVVPTFITLLADKPLDKLEGADPVALSSIVKKLIDASISDVSTVDEAAEKKANLDKRLSQLVNTAPVMLFMKGVPSAPRCGFSRQTVEILQNNNIPFASFDILTDEEVRQGLKVFSDWPTYPQLYVNGALIGGLDILKELASSDKDLKESLGLSPESLPALPPSPPSLQERLKSLITLSTVTLFMKGDPNSPKCGFSRSIVSLLQEEDISFAHFDILTDNEVREGLKVYSDWPTYPQLYVKGELVGGLDIVKEMKSNGSLKSQLGI